MKLLWRENFSPPEQKYFAKDYPDLTGYTALVTGASAGLGLETLRALALKNCRVLMGVRNREKGERVRQLIIDDAGDATIGQLDLVMMDLADLETLKDVPEQITNLVSGLDLIIHNAGTGRSKTKETKQGYDNIFGINVIGTFVLQKYLDPIFLKGSDKPLKRIVYVSSFGHHFTPKGGLDWDLVTGKKKFGSDFQAYLQSKAAIILVSYWWSVVHKKEVEDLGIISLNAHPGLVATEINRDESFFAKFAVSKLGLPSKVGALPILYGALSPDMTLENQGTYLVPYDNIGSLKSDVREAFNDGTAEKLWKWLDAL